MKRNVKQVHEIVNNLNYEEQDIHLLLDDCEEFATNHYAYKEGESSDTEPITVIIGFGSTENTVPSLDSCQN